MKTAAQFLGPLALILTLVPPILVATGTLQPPIMKTLLLVGCALWFVSAPTFMKGGDH